MVMLTLSFLCSYFLYYLFIYFLFIYLFTIIFIQGIYYLFTIIFIQSIYSTLLLFHKALLDFMDKLKLFVIFHLHTKVTNYRNIA